MSGARPSCPGDAEIQAFVEGRLGSELELEVEAHVDACEDCHDLIALIAVTSSGEIAAERSAPPDERYELLRPLGAGGRGVVWEARDLEIGGHVALKRLRSKDGESRELHEEVRLARRITHPNVCRIYDLGRSPDGEQFITMELLEGETLARRLERAACSIEEAVAILGQIVDALAAAHARGVVHRDLKPQNIMIDPDGRATVMDFGLASDLADVEEGGRISGTPAYWAPEQARGEAVTPATDVFALGRIAAEILDDPPPAAFEAFLAGCLAPEPQSRYATAGSAARALARARARLRRGSEPALSGEGFVGRAKELAELQQWLEGGERLITITGPAGVGKSRLARALGETDDPARWVHCELRDCASVGQLCSAVAAALTLPTSPGADEGDPVADVGAAIAEGGALRLVLDNLDRALQLSGDTLSDWLAAAPELRVLVSSRGRLQLPSERVLRVAPLPLADAAALFRERAELRRGEALGADEEALVREIALRLEGLPLALELAAARCAELTLAQLLARLGTRTTLLAGAAHALDWSWEDLEPHERSALTELSVFAGAFELDAAEAVVDLSAHPGAPLLATVLAALRDKSLLHAPAPQRFAMLAAVREHAATRGDAEAARLRHAEHFTSRKAEGLSRTELEAVVERALPAALRLRALLRLERHHLQHGPLRPFAQRLRELIVGAEASERRQGEMALARACLLLGRHEEAELRAESASQSAASEEVQGDAAESLLLLSVAKLRRGEHAEARAHVAEALRRARLSGDPAIEARGHDLLGYFQVQDEAPDEAELSFERSLELARHAGDRSAEGRALLRLARLAMDRDANRGRELYADAEPLLALLTSHPLGLRSPLSVGLRVALEDCRRSFGGTPSAAIELELPEAMVGRDRELAVLKARFELACEGRSELVVLSGYSGVGKSSLVHELYAPAVARGALVARGKCDEIRRTLPHAPISQAFGDLLRDLRGGAPEAIAALTTALRDALGANSAAIASVVPGLDVLIPTSAPLPELPPEAMRQRFNRSFTSFIAALAGPGAPLVIFLDDLQWADEASLELLEAIMCAPEIGHLLLVGAYRDEEVDAAHPLMATLDAIRRFRETREALGGVRALALQGLDSEALTDLLSACLQQPAGELTELGAQVFERTAGNPLFVRHLLRQWLAEQILYRDPQGGWAWRPSLLGAQAAGQDLGALLAASLGRLSPGALALLRTAAGIGAEFDCELLAAVEGRDADDIAGEIGEALRAGLLLAVDGDSRYRFHHDRVQAAAYAMVPAEERPTLHARIGRALLAAGEAPGERIFAIVEQLNLGLSPAPSSPEALHLAELNIEAGQRARRAAAYEPAARYFEVARGLLGPQLLSTHYAQGQPLLYQLAICRFLSGEPERAEALFTELLAGSRSALEKAQVLDGRLGLWASQGRHREALRLASEALALLGEDLPAATGRREVMAELLRLKWRLRGRAPESIAALPEACDPRALAALQLMHTASASAFFADVELYTLLVLRMCSLSLRHGISSLSAYSFGLYAMIAGPILGDMRGAQAFSRLARQLQARFGNVEIEPKLSLVLDGLVEHWSSHPRVCIPRLEAGVKAALESGDPLYAAFCSNQILYLRLLMGEPLARVREEAQRYLDFGRRHHISESPETFVIAERFIDALEGSTLSPSSLSDGSFDEARWLETLRGYELKIPEHFYYVLKLMLCVLQGEPSEALGYAKQARRLSEKGVATGYSSLQYFYAGLAAAQAGRARTTLLRSLHKLSRWAKHNPQSFAHQEALLRAELARLRGRDAEAMDHYEAAITGAREAGFTHNVALAHELAARFHLAAGRERIGRVYREDAQAAWEAYGAHSLVVAQRATKRA